MAYCLGQLPTWLERVFEKHVTFDRSQKGTDHNFALEPDGFRRFVRDIQRTPKMFQSKPSEEIGNEPVFRKLGKSLITSVSIQKGERFTVDNLSGRIFTETGIPVRESNQVIGKTAAKNLNAGTKLRYEDIG